MTSEEPSDEAEYDDCVQTHALAMTQEEGMKNLLPSKLQSMLTADQQERPHTTEYFEVPFETEYGNAIVLYAQAANVEVYRRYLVCAAWPGDANVGIVKIDETRTPAAKQIQRGLVHFYAELHAHQRSKPSICLQMSV